MALAGYMAEAQATQCDYPCASTAECVGDGIFCVNYGECPEDKGWCSDDPCIDEYYCYNESDCVEATGGRRNCCEINRCGPQEGYCC